MCKEFARIWPEYGGVGGLARDCAPRSTENRTLWKVKEGSPVQSGVCSALCTPEVHQKIGGTMSDFSVVCVI